MEEQVVFLSYGAPVFDVTDYSGWRSKMKYYLKKFGFWEIVMNLPIFSNKKTKLVALKESEKDNTSYLKFIMDGL